MVTAIVDPPVTDIPLTIEEAVVDDEVTPVIVLVLIVTVVPLEERIPVAILELVVIGPIELLEMDFVGEADELSIPVAIPVPAATPPMVFKLVLLVSVVAGCALLIPVEKVPDPDDEFNNARVLLFTLSVVAVPFPPIAIPVMFSRATILVIVFVDTEDNAPPKKFALSTVTLVVFKIQFENVFPVMVFVGQGVTPSVLLHPVTVVVPEVVILEKLLLLLLITAPATELPISE